MLHKDYDPSKPALMRRAARSGSGVNTTLKPLGLITYGVLMIEGIKETLAWRYARQAKKGAYGVAFAQSLAAALKRPFAVQIVVGLRRSGNHAFINWFASQSHGPVFFFNNVDVNLSPLERQKREFFFNDVRNTPTLLFSYEDKEITDVLGGGLAEFMSHFDSQIVETGLAIVIRDPKNMLASRFKKWPGELEDSLKWKNVLKRYREHLNLATSRTCNMDGFQVVSVFYDKLCGSQDYRDRLSADLGIKQGSKGLNSVTPYGHGSSFDLVNADGNASIMDVGSRWQYFSHDQCFQDILKTDEMRDIEQDLENAIAAA